MNKSSLSVWRFRCAFLYALIFSPDWGLKAKFRLEGQGGRESHTIQPDALPQRAKPNFSTTLSHCSCPLECLALSISRCLPEIVQVDAIVGAPVIELFPDQIQRLNLSPEILQGKRDASICVRESMGHSSFEDVKTVTDLVLTKRPFDFRCDGEHATLVQYERDAVLVVG